MATKKKAAPKKKSPPPKKIIKEQPPIRIIVEVVVRFEGLSADNKFKILSVAGATEVLTGNFSYAFQRQGITILTFSIDDYIINNPPDSGSFQKDVTDPNVPQKVRLQVTAREDSPGGNGTISLKFENKDVFATPEPIPFSGGVGKINKLISLPQ